MVRMECLSTRALEWECLMEALRAGWLVLERFVTVGLQVQKRAPMLAGRKALLFSRLAVHNRLLKGSKRATMQAVVSSLF